MTRDSARLGALERTIGRLANELAEAQRELAEIRGLSSQGSAAAPAAPAAPAAHRGGADLEKLIGRYGALALAVLTIVMGAGALVSWAIAHGMLGPWVRVTLGAFLAVTIAGTGWWLRARASRRFGNVLLALSLAVLHVVAWGAGPQLGLLPSWVSLSVADAAALALAALALAENEELFYTVGLGGALLAPFMMATGEPNFGMLAAYGVILLATAIGTIGGRAWWKAIGLVLAGTVIYTMSVRGFRSGVPWVDREFAVAFAGVVGAFALVWERKPARPWIAVGALATMAVALVAHRAGPSADSRLAALVAAPDVQVLALVGTALFFAAVRDFSAREQSEAWMLAVMLVPTAFLSAALHAVGPIEGPISGSLVLAWAVAYAAASLGEQGWRRGVLITASGLGSLWAITLVLGVAADAVPVVAAAHAVLLAAVSKREKQPIVLLSTGVSLVVAFWLAATPLLAQPGYTTTPFLSLPSVGAASAVAAAFLSARYGLPDRVPVFGEEIERGRAGALAAAAFAFLWGILELRRAFSADASTFLLIAYYATCGVLAIHRGRARGERHLRQVGLTLAVLAALDAVVETSSVQQIGLRVGSYLLVGVFLLAVAWWYRGEGRNELE